MNRIERLFNEKAGEILSVYITAGYPRLDDTADLLRYLQQYGADMVEIGIPFSDPLADGPVIQQSSQAALRNGMSMDLLFEQLQGIRSSVQIPLLLMGYLNPVLHMGMENFLRKCAEAGIDGVILPDLPPGEYEEKYLGLFRRYGIFHTMLITPHTDEERIRWIAGLSEGFLYMVSAASTTGARNGITTQQVDYFRRIQGMELPVPSLIGFGISSRQTFTTACRYARGAIIGSAFIRALGTDGSLEKKVEIFLHSILRDE